MFDLIKPKFGPMIFYMQTIHDYVVERLGESRGSWPEVSKSSGVSYGTLKKIYYRKIVSPRVKHLEKLASYFRKPTHNG